MTKRMHRFTLVEMLTVIAIISILAGLVIPVVVIAQERGRETQAKSDITALMSALKQFETDYGRMLVYQSGVYRIGGKQGTVGNKVKTLKTDYLNSQGKPTPNTTIDNLAKVDNDGDNAYDALIIELSAPKTADFSVSVNKRKKMYLEPKKGFDPTLTYDHNPSQSSDWKIRQEPTLWRDPWGNPYLIYIKVSADNFIALPGTNKNLATNLAIYSFGPNGTDDKGCNVALDTCIVNNATAADHKLHDDIASWDL